MQYNFNSLDFSGIPQHEAQARQARYKAWQDITNSIGQGIKQGADAWADAYKYNQQRADQQEQNRLAEEWRRRQWENQIQQQAIQNQRYEAEQARLRAERVARVQDANRIKHDMMSMYSPEDIAKYGPGAQFAWSQMVNSTDYDNIASGGRSLASIIAQQDMIDAQRAEQAQASLGQNYSLGLNTRLGLMGFDPNRPEQSVAAVPTTEGGNELQGYLNNLQRERMGLEGFMRANPDRVTPEMIRQYNDIRNGINATVRRMHPKGRDWGF